jgi:hypothetical protein
VPQIRIFKTEDKRSLTIEVEGCASMTFSAEVITQILPALIALRSQMEPPLESRDLQAGDQVIEADGMRWAVGRHEVEGKFRVALHHPGLGWLSIPMNLQGYDQLRDALDKQLPHLAGYNAPTMQ